MPVYILLISKLEFFTSVGIGRAGDLHIYIFLLYHMLTADVLLAPPVFSSFVFAWSEVFPKTQFFRVSQSLLLIFFTYIFCHLLFHEGHGDNVIGNLKKKGLMNSGTHGYIYIHPNVPLNLYARYIFSLTDIVRSNRVKKS